MDTTGLLQAWAALYANHAAIRTAVTFTHIAGVTVGGGAAISADRATIRASRRDGWDRAGQLQALAGTHRVVIGCLAFVVASGVLQFGSDAGTFLHSIVFWVKMGLVAVLLLNGSMLLAFERRAGRNPLEDGPWQRLRLASIFSLVLWLGTILAGTALLSA